MRHYINNTGKPIMVHSWVLQKPIDENTAKFLISNGITVRVVNDVSTFTNNYGMPVSFAGNWNIEFETTSKDQESVLKLMFGNDIILLMAQCVLPNATNEVRDVT